jgi:HlyD family secretion protein
MIEIRPKLAPHGVGSAPNGIAMDRALPQTLRWRRLSTRILATSVVFVLALLLWLRPSHVQSVDSPRLATVISGEFVDELAVRARVEPLQSIQLDAVEAGRVEAVYAQDGDWVAAGDPLYRLHSPEQEQLLMQRSSEVAQQLANVSIQRSAQAASVAQNRRELAQLQAAQHRTESEYRRLERLASAGFVAAAAVEEAQRERQLAAQLFQQARDDHRVESDIRQHSLDEMARAVDGLQRGLQMLERARDRLQQHSPIAGRLTGFQLQVGTTVRPGDRLGRIDGATGGMQLVTDVDEYYLPRLKVGQKGTTAGSGTLELTQTLPQVRDGKVRLLLRWTEPASPQVELRPGQAVDVRLQMSPRARALLLSDGPGVQELLYVRQGNQLHRRAVRLGRRAAGQVEVLAGLRAGEEVLISQPPTDAERFSLP